MKHSAVLAREVSLPFGGKDLRSPATAGPFSLFVRPSPWERPLERRGLSGAGCLQPGNLRVFCCRFVRLSPPLGGDRRLLCFLRGPDASFPPRFAANDSGPMPEPSNEVPAKSASAGVRRLFYECLRSPLKPAFRRAPEASVKTARWMRRHLPGSFWVPFCGKKVQNTRDIVAAFSVLLMAKVPKPSACRFSREQPPARVERAQ